MPYLHSIPTRDIWRSFVLAKKSHSRASWRSVGRCRIRSKYFETVSSLVGGVVVVEAVGGAVDAVGPVAGAGPIVNRDGRDASVGSSGSLTVPVTSGAPGSVLEGPLLLPSSVRGPLLGDARGAARRSLAVNSVEVSMGVGGSRLQCGGVAHSLGGLIAFPFGSSKKQPSAPLRGLPASLVLEPRLSPSHWRRYHWCSSLQRGLSRRSEPGQPQL